MHDLLIKALTGLYVGLAVYIVIVHVLSKPPIWGILAAVLLLIPAFSERRKYR